MQARQVARLGLPYTTQAVEHIERAQALRPDDPRVQATHAILLSRLAFFTADPGGVKLRRASELVRAALTAAPDLAEAHLAAGHHELHVGDPVIATGHYRVAVACAPFLAEAHEHLGRVLMEAGYLEAAYARFEEASAIAPQYSSASFEVARALALERKWDEHEQMMLRIDARRRPLSTARAAWWRGDMAALRTARAEIGSVFEADLMRQLIDVFLENTWETARDTLVAKALDSSSPSRRRKVFIAQIIAEAAAHVGDHDSCRRVLEHATSIGLFDLHWFDRVPTFDRIRGELGQIRAQVEARARGIYDALYGDHAVGLTMLATD